MIEESSLPGLSLARWRAESSDLRQALESLEQRMALSEPRIHAFVAEGGRFERLRREVERLASGPLHGVPLGVKDIFHVAGLETHAGSKLPADVLRGPEAECVRLLKQAGAFVLGKTVSTEFAYFAAGPTRNPHRPDHTPGGSSSGSAAAVAAGLCPLALGTQTIGSISRPASFCGVVGFKPTFGRISTAGVIPLSPSLDHIGTFTANVADAALAASILCTDWGATAPDKKPVLGVPRGSYLDRASTEGRAHFRKVCDVLTAAGWETVTVEALADLDDIVARHQTILAAEAAQVHRDWHRRFRDLYHPTTSELIERGRSISPTVLSEALGGRERLREDLTELAENHGIDLWISPAATGPAPFGLESTGDPIMNLPWTHAGLPTVSLPTGCGSSGLPMGLQVVAGWQEDERLLAWCERLESSWIETG